MLSEQENKQYNRQIILPELGLAGQQKLKEASVLVVGAGGLGCPALMYLAGGGVGKIGIIDPDVVEVSNLHRQLLYTHQDLGKSKALVAAERLRSNNPNITFEVYEARMESRNALEILKGYDVVIDGTDNFATRYLINDACVILKKPFVYGAIMKFEGQLSVFNYQGGPTYRCLFPKPPEPGTVPTCGEVGVLGVLPGLIGTYQALEVIKLITGLGKIRSGELLIMNTLDNSQMSLKIRLKPENMKVTELIDYQQFCGVKEGNNLVIDIHEFDSRISELIVLDVREPAEVAAYNIGGIFIPLAQLKMEHQQLPKHKPLVVVCASGQRSLAAVKMLKAAGFTDVWSLQGGLKEYQKFTSSS